MNMPLVYVSRVFHLFLISPIFISHPGPGHRLRGSFHTRLLPLSKSEKLSHIRLSALPVAHYLVAIFLYLNESNNAIQSSF